MGWTERRLDPDDSQFVELGQIIDGYRLERELGRSAHGVSFYARRVSAGPLTWNAAMVSDIGVVKLLWPPMGLRSERARARFHGRFARETQDLRTAIGILIPSAAEAGAAQVISWGGVPDHPYMIRSYVDGYSLAQRLMNLPQGLPLPEVAYYVTRAASALDYAHARGITHGALTLENMLVSREGDLLVSDFGIECLLFPLGEVSAPPPSPQLARYYTPERFSGDRATPAMDIYSLGVALYALVCGQFPFDGATVEEIRRARVSAAAPSPSMYRPDLPPQVEAVMMKALAKSSRDGFETAGALASAFAAAVEGATGEKIVMGHSAQGTVSGALSRSEPANRPTGGPGGASREARPGAPETHGDEGSSGTRLPRPFLPPGADSAGAHGASSFAMLPNSTELRELEELETARLSEEWTTPPSAAVLQRVQPMRPLDTHPPAIHAAITEAQTAPLEEQGAALQPDTAKSPRNDATRGSITPPPAGLGPIEPAAPAMRLGAGAHARRGWRLQTRGGVIVGALLIIVVGAMAALTHTAHGGSPAPSASATSGATVAAGATVTEIASVTSAPTTTSHPVTSTPKPTVKPTMAPSSTPSPTNTPTATPTSTPTATPTDTPTATPTSAS